MAIPPRDLEALHVDYEGNELLLPQVSAKHDISESGINRIAHREGWRLRRPRRVDRNDMVMRMFRVLEAQIRKLEEDMTKTPGVDHAAALSRLVTTLDRLIEIKDAEARKHKAPRRDSNAMVELRAKIADRIAQFAGA